MTGKGMRPSLALLVHRARTLFEVGPGITTRLALAHGGASCVLVPSGVTGDAFLEKLREERRSSLDRLWICSQGDWSADALRDADTVVEYLATGLVACVAVGHPPDVVVVDAPLADAWVAQGLLMGAPDVVVCVRERWGLERMADVCEPIAYEDGWAMFVRQPGLARSALRDVVVQCAFRGGADGLVATTTGSPIAAESGAPPMRDTRTPRRIVMVVANGVLRDSRVLKSARSAVLDGYEVLVLGDAGNGDPEEFELDGFTVRLLKGSSDLRRAIRHAEIKNGVDAVDVREAPMSKASARLEWESLLDLSTAVEDHMGLQWRTWPKGLETAPVLLRELAASDPDIVHCHDMHYLPIVAAFVGMEAATGRRRAWVYDAHELVEGLWPTSARSQRVVATWTLLERQLLRRADAVITVSGPLADALRANHSLEVTPTVVLNSPTRAVASLRLGWTVRDAAMLPPDVPLLVYAGGITQGRGVETAIDGLRYLPDVHLAVVCVPSPDAPYARTLQDFAVRTGVDSRVHLVAPAEPAHVCSYLSGADIGVHTMLRCGNHDIALPNKLFEYLFSGLPMVVSDVPALASFVESGGYGRSFTAGDSREFALAVRRVLADLPGHRAAAQDPSLVETYAWETQAEALLDTYRCLLLKDT